MKKDIEIQNNVLEEIRQLPSVNASTIGVAVKNGIVTLSGSVDSYPKRIAIERATLAVRDVIGIAEEIRVQLVPAMQVQDTELAQAVLHAIEWNSGLDPKRIHLIVENGSVRLEGEVDWEYQRKLAYRNVYNIKGVREVTNNIRITQKPFPIQVNEKIKSAFERNANIDASKVEVKVEGNKVILSGTVKCYTEKKEAESCVWRIPGVTEVVNQLNYEEDYDTSEVL